MKKIIVFLILMSFFLTSVTSSKASQGGIPLKEFPTGSILRQSIAYNNGREAAEKIFLLPETSFNYQEAAAIINRICLLPESLLDKTNKAGVRIKLFTGMLTENQTVKHLRGVVPRGYTNGATWDTVPGIGGSKVVLVKIGASDKGMGHGSINLELHELAHSIDKQVLNTISSQRTFIDIWERERGTLFPGKDYFIFYPEEYFAESFAMYYFNGNTRYELKKRAPETYKFLRNMK